MTLDWQDGQPYSPLFGDVYFSSGSGIDETRHVFLQGNRLPQRFSDLADGANIRVGETGFGTGLNFLCVWQLFVQVAPPGASLDYFSLEKFPLDDDDLRDALMLWPQLQDLATQLRQRWRRRVPGWNRWSFAGGRVRLTLVLDDVGEALAQLPPASIDAWLLDGFAPAKNQEMWNTGVMAGLARASRPNATLATYTSAGWVRRGLQQAGFNVERVPGFGQKREMMHGSLDILHRRTACSPRKDIPRKALVIGGGIAGCAVAQALAQRGISVTLAERESRLASAASGNPLGILHARFGAGDNPVHRFVLAAYGHALALYDEVLPVDGEVRDECGLLQLECNETEIRRIGRLTGEEWPHHLLRFVTAEDASYLCGMRMEMGGLWFPAGGWVVPPRLCENLAADARIVRELGMHVETLQEDGAGWRAIGRDVDGEAWSRVADIIVVCCAHSARQIDRFGDIPLTPVRGQITLLPETPQSHALHAVVCGDGYCAPAIDGRHVTGATHAFDDASCEVRAGDHRRNLEKLAAYAPHLFAAFGSVDIDKLEGRAAVRCSTPGAMPLAGEVQPGLYCSLGHGTRGLLSAGLAAEVVASQACGQLPPLPGNILGALAPGRYMPNTGSRNELRSHNMSSHKG